MKSNKKRKHEREKGRYSERHFFLIVLILDLVSYDHLENVLESIELKQNSYINKNKNIKTYKKFILRAAPSCHLDTRV